MTVVTAEESLSLANRLRCTDNALIITAEIFARVIYVEGNIVGENKN